MAGASRRVRQGGTLTLVFGVVLMGGAAAGAWGGGAGALPRRAASADVAAAGGYSSQQAERLVASGEDRWAAYYSAEDYARFAQGLDGRYLGVGLSVDRDEDGETVVSGVQSAGPAAGAGIAVGDRLLSVDGASVDRLPVTEVVARLRGRADELSAGARPAGPGSSVLLALRSPRGGARAVTLRRTVLDTQDVTVDRPASGVLRIAVAAFTSGVGAEIRAAVQRAPAAAKRTGIVLDLRGNSGGLVEEAVAAASVFLDGGPVASYQSGGERRDLTAGPGGDTGTPLVVLVDGGTMSAAELLAGALQDRCRAVLVGSRTFGKGTVQQPSRLADGSVLELTVGRYYTPAGRSPDGVGLAPDVPAADPADAGPLALRVLAGLGGARKPAADHPSEMRE
ncbi:S41 family peptidase [Kitasatospora sp. MAA4]|uniref:S41 family peptidase n=1 Tax=Kitasatospora sp. MAA4 TaxID=3035093 RepID=UPI00247349F8|nr:S41 family peptidase [Kitasatospora sp. MAA4]